MRVAAEDTVEAATAESGSTKRGQWLQRGRPLASATLPMLHVGGCPLPCSAYILPGRGNPARRRFTADAGVGLCMASAPRACLTNSAAGACPMLMSIATTTAWEVDPRHHISWWLCSTRLNREDLPPPRGRPKPRDWRKKNTKVGTTKIQ